jgi:hypothetical protein
MISAKYHYFISLLIFCFLRLYLPLNKNIFMQYLLWVLGLGILGFFIGKFIKHKSLYPFMPFQYDFRKRRNTFLKSLELLDKINAKIIIETGTSREGLHGAKSNGEQLLYSGNGQSKIMRGYIP